MVDVQLWTPFESYCFEHECWDLAAFYGRYIHLQPMLLLFQS